MIDFFEGDQDYPSPLNQPQGQLKADPKEQAHHVHRY